MLQRINWLLPKLWFKGLIFVCMPYNKKHSTQRCSNTSYVERPLIQYDKPTQEACFLVRLGLNLDLERREQSNHFYTILIYKWNTYVIFSVTHISQFPKYQKGNYQWSKTEYVFISPNWEEQYNQRWNAYNHIYT